MAGFRLTAFPVVFTGALVFGCVAFFNRKKCFPEVFEQQKQIRLESIEKAIEFREAIRKKKEEREKRSN